MLDLASTERLLAPRHVPRPTGQEVKGGAPAAGRVIRADNPPRQRSRREQLDARGGQLDGERQPVEMTADLRDRRRLRVVGVEAGHDDAGTLDEQPNGRRRRQRGRCRRAGGIGQRQRLDRLLALPAQVERRSTGRHDLQSRAGREQPTDQVGGIEDLLKSSRVRYVD